MDHIRNRLLVQYRPSASCAEMQRVFTDLDIRGGIRTSAERDRFVRSLPEPAWSGIRSIRFEVPPPFLRIESVYIDDGAASRWRNFVRVREALRRMIEVMEIGARSITVSTVGMVPGMRT